MGQFPVCSWAFSFSHQRPLGGSDFAAIQQIEGLFLTPKIVGSHSDLHPVTVILAVIGGEMLWGFGGMIIAVPLVAVLKSAALAIYERMVRARLID